MKNFVVSEADRGDCAVEKLVKDIVSALVDNPEKVKVDVTHGSQSSVIELRVAKEDLGKVIGRQGRTAQAIRTVLKAASSKLNKRMVLEIVE